MLFTSPEFLFGFLPSVILITWLALRVGGQRAAICVLIASSFWFYASWALWALLLLLASTAANLAAGHVLLLLQNRDDRVRRSVFAVFIAANLAVLFYFKYANFFLNGVGMGDLAGTLSIVLPLGISFITFQKIAFLSDIHRGNITSIDPLGFVALIAFFPQLIAGPIVHYKQVVPQFFSTLSITGGTLALGFSVFVMGLTKKIFVADVMATYASPVFAASQVQVVGPAVAWMGALAYTMQIYFDFSGYSDMAIGLGLMFGIALPLNFLSPYKATSIIEFWRRWHITLSSFLRDYLYIPLGGNRHGSLYRYRNLFLTMLLGGLWHGAAWTFVVWGALHGVYLITNHLWRSAGHRLPAVLGWCLTFMAVVVAWVFFRAADFSAAANMLRSMAGEGGWLVPDIVLAYFGATESIPYWGAGLGYNPIDWSMGWMLVSASMLLALVPPNTAELFGLEEGRGRVMLGSLFASPPAIGLYLWLSMLSILGGAPTEFIYFQF